MDDAKARALRDRLIASEIRKGTDMTLYGVHIKRAQPGGFLERVDPAKAGFYEEGTPDHPAGRIEIDPSHPATIQAIRDLQRQDDEHAWSDDADAHR